MKIYVIFKRLLDILFSLFLLIFLSPLFVIITILIRLDSKGPAIFVQTRIGHNKKRFDMYKFRTMVVGAELQQKILLEKNEAHFPAFKIKNDPRLTGFGKKLRKTGLDELPQLLNILKGEMSFIGFRPPLPEEVKHYKKWHMKRFSGIPGILSFWVVEGEHNLSFDEWINLDLIYVKEMSIFSDMYIFSKYFLLFCESVLQKLYKKSFRKINFSRISRISRNLFRYFFRYTKFMHLLKKSRTKNRTIIFYVNYVKGLGHLSRTMKLSNELCNNCPDDKIIILTDTKLIHLFHPNCEIIKLPALEFKNVCDDSKQGFISSHQKAELLQLRIKLLDDILKSYKPDLLFIDYRPKGLNDELEFPIKHLKKKPYLILRDILDDPKEIEKTWNKKKYIDFLKKQYSGIYIFGDKSIYDMTKKYSFDAIDHKIKYMGYIVNSSNYVKSSRKRILITVGSGCIGYNIIKKVLDCGNFREDVRVITGPAMKKTHYSSLVDSYPSIDFVKYEHDMPKEINEASLVICMGGYNTSTEILESDVPVLIIPLEESDNMEQYIRAELFKKHKLCNYISYADLTKTTLRKAIIDAKRISTLRKTNLKKIRLDGGKNFRKCLDELK